MLLGIYTIRIPLNSFRIQSVLNKCIRLMLSKQPSLIDTTY